MHLFLICRHLRNIDIVSSLIHRHSSQRHFIEHIACLQFSTQEQQTSSPTAVALSLLRTKCGLSANAAMNIAKKLKFKSLKSVENAQSVVEVLEKFDFSNTDIATLITKHAGILNSNVEKNMKPKLEFYRRIGLQPKSIASNPLILYASLQSRLIPNFELLKSFLPNNELMKMLRYWPSVLARNLNDDMLPRINVLLEYGVPNVVITSSLVKHARSFFSGKSNFEEAFEEIKQLNISPDSLMFARALGVLAPMTKSLRKKKIDNYTELGWSKEQLIIAFTRYPHCMAISNEKARKSVRFFSEKLDWGPKHLSLHPILLCFSLEERVIPRFEVWRILVSKGLIKDKIAPPYFKMSEKLFEEKYVIKFKNKVPELLSVMKRRSKNQHSEL